VLDPGNKKQNNCITMSQNHTMNPLGRPHQSCNDTLSGQCFKGSLYERIMQQFLKDRGQSNTPQISCENKGTNGSPTTNGCSDAIFQRQDATEVKQTSEVAALQRTEFRQSHSGKAEIPVTIDDGRNLPALVSIEDSFSTLSSGDQWREVEDQSTGRTYYYNRRTRESSWYLPPNAILLQKKRRLAGMRPIESDQRLQDNARNLIGADYTSLDEHTFTVNPNSSSASCNEDSVEGHCEVEVSLPDQIYRYSDTSHTCEKMIVPMISDDCKGAKGRNRRFSSTSEDSQGCKPMFVIDNESTKERPNAFSPQVSVLHAVQETSYDDGEAPTSSGVLYCVYCGKMYSIDSHSFARHINECGAMKKCLTNEPLTQRRTQHILLKSWGLTLDSLGQENGEDKENIPPHSRSPVENFRLQQPLPTNDVREQSFEKVAGKSLTFQRTNLFQVTASDYVDSNADVLATAVSGQDKNSFRSRSGRFTEEDDFYCIGSDEETSPVQSSCPFCSRSFGEGNQLSKHLLKCRARKKSSKKRRSLPSVSTRGNNRSSREELDRGPGSNLQSLLITGGGRHLPGYPKVTDSPPGPSMAGRKSEYWTNRRSVSSKCVD